MGGVCGGFLAICPQPALNIPTSYVAVATSGTINVDVLIAFRDTTDTAYNGQFEAELNIPYDGTTCPPMPGTIVDFYDNSLATLAFIEARCSNSLLITPSMYLAAVQNGHMIKWASTAYSSAILYGPGWIPPGTPAWQQQAVGGTAIGAIALPYETVSNSTVVRIATRYGEGYGNETPLSWFGEFAISTVQPSIMQTQWNYSQPFTIVIEPAYEVQFKTVPTMILYQPPGNQSTARVDLKDTYSQKYETGQTTTLTSSDELDRKTAQDLSFEVSLKAPLLSFSLTDTLSKESWDNSVKTATGQQYGTSVSSVVTQGKSVTYATGALPTPWPDFASLSFGTEPFWSDLIYFSVNPQFNVWDYPDGLFFQALGSASIQYESVRTLASCAPHRLGALNLPGATLSVPYVVTDPTNNQTTSYTLSLSPSDCTNLLQLDPFWVSLSQAASPPVGFLFDQDATFGTAPYIRNNSTITDFTTATTFKQSFNGTVTAAGTNMLSGQPDTSVNATLGIFQISANNSGSNTNTQQNQIEIDISTTQSSQTESSFSASVTIQDCPLSTTPSYKGEIDCSGASGSPTYPMVVFQDSRFGSLLVQTPNLSVPIPQTGGNLPGGVIFVKDTPSPQYSDNYRVMNPTRPIFGFRSGELPSKQQALIDLANIRVANSPRGTSVGGTRNRNRSTFAPVMPVPLGPGHIISLTNQRAQLLAEFPIAAPLERTHVDGGPLLGTTVQRTPDGRIRVVK
jgi:hypothetical protein